MTMTSTATRASLLFALIALVPRRTAATDTPRWGIATLTFHGPVDTPARNAFEIELSATFRLKGAARHGDLIAHGYYDGGAIYRVKFSPPHEGVWEWSTNSSEAALAGLTGSVRAVAATSHGPVISRGFGLQSADGSPHVSVGTTSYQWASEPFARQRETLATLRQGPFNKIRMTIFPKWYVYNHANPVEAGTPYQVLPGSLAANASAWGCVGAKCPSLAGSFDLRRFNVSFWQNYEALVSRLRDQGIVADVILFHPYDNGHWGFDCNGGRDADKYDTALDRFYLRYAAARLAAYSNVWWSMANEWSFCACKSKGINSTHLESPSPIWDTLFETLAAHDPYGRQKSIHNGNLLYNHSRPWITHVSLQGLEGKTAELRAKYGKPVIWDEVQYEGDIPQGWGALSGEEMADRFYWGASLGVHVGHSETILWPNVSSDDAQPLWWAKGGKLRGASPARIAFFRDVWKGGLAEFGIDFGALEPSALKRGHDDYANVLTSKDGNFLFVHFLRIGTWEIPLKRRQHERRRADDAADDARDADGRDARSRGGPPGACWKVAALDYWREESGWSNHTIPASSQSARIEVTRLPANVIVAYVGT